MPFHVDDNNTEHGHKDMQKKTTSYPHANNLYFLHLLAWSCSSVKSDKKGKKNIATKTNESQTKIYLLEEYAVTYATWSEKRVHQDTP